jgi:hypothetical protein
MAIQLDPLAIVYSRVPINGEDEVRLLLLHATKATRPADEIHCSLVVCRRDHVFDKYYALSYTWGDSNCHHTITVNGVKGVPVTHNLFAVLKRLRDLDTFQTRTSWVDALCIYQAESVERSLQVQRMREVYHSADRVVIWLGDSNCLENHPAARHLWKASGAGRVCIKSCVKHRRAGGRGYGCTKSSALPDGHRSFVLAGSNLNRSSSKSCCSRCIKSAFT